MLMTSRRTESTPSADQRSASVLLNGLRILEAFTVAEPALGVTEIARRVGQHKSTVSRILSSLESAGYVTRDQAGGRYRLGLGLMRLAGPLLADLDVRSASHPALDELSDATQETAALMVWNGTESVVVEQVPSPQQVKHTTAIGTRYNTIGSASYRVFLAWADTEVVTAVLGTPSQADVHALERVRESGFAVNDGQTSIQEMGISAPVRDHRGAVVAAVLMSAPRFRMSPDLVEKYAKRVQDAADMVSRRLGGEIRSTKT